MDTLNPNVLYMIRSINGSTLNITGTPVDPAASPIALSSGWNWIGYHPLVSLPFDDALASITLSDYDYIKNQTGFSTYYDTYGWFGSISHMHAYDGYMLKVANAGSLVYPSGGSSKKSAATYTGSLTETALNPHQFEHSGSLTTTLFMDGRPTGSEDDLLLAYAGDQCRGVSSGFYFNPSGAFIYPLMIYSNIPEGEIVTFKYYDAESDQLYICAETITFKKDMVIADALNALELNISSAVNLPDLKIDAGLSLSIYPNPFHDQLTLNYTLTEASNISLIAYDIYGKLIKVLNEEAHLPGSHTIHWDASDMPGGTYIIKLSIDKNQIVKRVVLIE